MKLGAFAVVGTVVVAVTGCQPDHQDFPPLPGGGGGGGGGGGIGGGGTLTDAATTDGQTLLGDLCLLSDLRDFTSCATTGAGGITIEIGAETALTADDGTFEIAEPTGTGLAWRASGIDIVPSVVPFSSQLVVYAIASATFDDLSQSNGVLLAGGQGSVVVHALSGTAPVEGATVTTDPVAQFTTFYDGTSATVWDQDATGPGGVAWVPGVAAGTVTVTVSPSSGTPQITNVTVDDGAITFVPVGL